MLFFRCMNIYNFCIFFHKNSAILSLYSIFNKFEFLWKFYKINELLWQEGLFLDFLQKKIANTWIKSFLIYSSYLFNERLLFDKLTRFYLDLIIWPFHRLFIFEFFNIGNVLFVNIFFLFFITFLIFLVFFMF